MNKRKICLFLGGGLGNVLFQLNFAYKLINQGNEVFINTALVENKNLLNILKWTHHPNTIRDLFNLRVLNHEDFILSDNVLPCLGFLPGLRNFLNYKIYFNINPKEKITHKGIFGYFQTGVEINEKFRMKINQGVKNYIKLNKLLLPDDEELVVHYRGGDYLNSDLQNPDESYHMKQISLSQNFKKTTVITNDTENAKKLFNTDSLTNDVRIISSKNMLDDFCYLASAKHIAISNSTFSWWASEVSEARLIYEPKTFFKHLPSWKPSSIHSRIEI